MAQSNISIETFKEKIERIIRETKAKNLCDSEGSVK